MDVDGAGEDQAAPRVPPGRAGRAARRAGTLARAGAGRVRTAAAADGAGESGMSALLGTHALSSAGDALVAVALAGTVFFAVPVGEARDRVALYLLLTLLPFSLLVPVAGPLLDRLRHGRRDVLAVTNGARGLVAWSAAGLTASLGLYPLALAALVLSRAYGVARSAALPRVRPPGVTPVQANARMNVAAVASASVAGALGAGLAAVAGPPWVLRLAGVVLLAAAVCAVKLPPRIDEERVHAQRGVRRPAYRLLAGPVEVQRALVSAVALRGLAGLLTIFLAFLLKGAGAPALVVAAVLGAAVAGQLLGTALASRLPERTTARLTVASLLVPAGACLLAAVGGGAPLAALAAGLTGLSYALSKFALDGVLQGVVPPESTSGAFARSETGLQLAWAAGGGLALLLPPVPAAGFAVAAAVPLLGVAATARVTAGLRVLPRRAGRPAEAGPAAPAAGSPTRPDLRRRDVGPGAEDDAAAWRRDDTTVWYRDDATVRDRDDTTAWYQDGASVGDRDDTAVRGREDTTVWGRDETAVLGRPPATPSRPAREQAPPQPRDRGSERGSVLDRWRYQAGGRLPRRARR